MTLDDLRPQWNALDLDLQQRLQRATRVQVATLTRGHRSLWWLQVHTVFALMLNLLGLAGLSWYAVSRWPSWELVLPALGLAAALGVELAGGVHELVQLSRVDFAAPLVVAQRHLEAVRVMRLREVEWLLLTAPLLGILCAVVFFDVLFGTDLWQQATFWRFFWVNVAFGLSWLLLLRFLRVRYAARVSNTRVVRWLVDELSGHTLRTALAALDRLAEFEKETPTPP